MIYSLFIHLSIGFHSSAFAVRPLLEPLSRGPMLETVARDSNSHVTNLSMPSTYLACSYLVPVGSGCEQVVLPAQLTVSAESFCRIYAYTVSEDEKVQRVPCSFKKGACVSRGLKLDKTCNAYVFARSILENHPNAPPFKKVIPTDIALKLQRLLEFNNGPFGRYANGMTKYANAIHHAFTFQRAVMQLGIPTAWHAASVSGTFWAMLTTLAARMRQVHFTTDALSSFPDDFSEVVDKLAGGRQNAILLRSRTPEELARYSPKLQEGKDRELVDSVWVAGSAHIFGLTEGEEVIYFLNPGAQGGANGKTIQRSKESRQKITEGIVADFFDPSRYDNVLWKKTIDALDTALTRHQGWLPSGSSKPSNRPVLMMLAMSPHRISDIACVTGPYGRRSTKDVRDDAGLLGRILALNGNLFFTRAEDEQLRISPTTQENLGTIAFPFFESEDQRFFWESTVGGEMSKILQPLLDLS